MTRKDYALIAVIIILIGSNVFSGNGNWKLRKEIKESKAREAILKDSVNTRNQAIAERDTLIFKYQISTSKLSTKHDSLNEEIVSDFPSYDVVVSLEPDSQTVLLTEWLSKVDSLSR